MDPEKEKEINFILSDINKQLKLKLKEEKDNRSKFNTFIEKGITDYHNKDYETSLLNLAIGLNNKKDYITEQDNSKYNDLISIIVNKLTNDDKDDFINQLDMNQEQSKLQQINETHQGLQKINKSQETKQVSNIILQSGSGYETNKDNITPDIKKSVTDSQQINESVLIKKMELNHLNKNISNNKFTEYNFKSIPGYTDIKKILYEKFMYPNIFSELFYSNKHNMLLYGPAGNNKKMIARMCIGELQNLSQDLSIVYIELDLQKMLVYDAADIDKIFSNLDEKIQLNKAKFKISRGIIYFENINYLYNNGEVAILLSKLFKNLEKTENKENFMILASTNSLSSLPQEIFQKFQNNLFIDLPNFFERVFYLFEFIILRYKENFPNKLLNLYFEVDMSTETKFCKNFLKYREIYLNKDGVDLLSIYPRLNDIIIEISPEGEKMLDTEKIDDYKNRLKEQVEFINNIDGEYYKFICNEIDTLENKKTILSLFKDQYDYDKKIIVNFNHYMVKFTKEYSINLIKYSKITNDNNNLQKILKYLEKNLFDFFIFLHYLAELIGPNIEIYKIGLLKDKKFSDNTISSYGLNVNDIELLIKNMTSKMASNIIDSKFKNMVPINNCKTSLSINETDYSTCYRKIDTDNNTNSFFKIAIGDKIDNSSMFTLVDKNESVFDILAFLKMSYFYHALKDTSTDVGNNDDYCMYICEKNLIKSEKCTSQCNVIQKFVL